MTTHSRRVAVAALCAGAALALTACTPFGGATSGPGAGAGTPGSGAGATTAASSPADPTAGLPNGTKLADWLLPASAVPKLKANPKIVNNSGDSFYAPSDAPVAKAKACDLLNQSNWATATGVGPDSYAGRDYDDSYGDEFYQELDAYEGTRAARQFTALKQVLAGCASFKTDAGGTTYTVHTKVKALTGLGDEAVEAVLTSPGATGGATLVAIRSGKVLVTTWYSDQSGTGSEGLALARQLLKKVPAAAG